MGTNFPGLIREDNEDVLEETELEIIDDDDLQSREEPKQQNKNNWFCHQHLCNWSDWYNKDILQRTVQIFFRYSKVERTRASAV